MFKKAGHIFIIVLLLFSTTGITITRHYCGRDLVQTSIYSTPHSCCDGICPRCHNEKIDIRISDKYQSSKSGTDFTAQFKTLLKDHSLPAILAFSGSSGIALNYTQGDHPVKPFSTKPMCAECSTPFLQVFLF
jgi:hypothetical protein